MLYLTLVEIEVEVGVELGNFLLLDSSREDKVDPVKLDETQKVIELNEDNMEEPIEPVENSCGCCALVNIARNIGKKWKLRIL